MNTNHVQIDSKDEGQQLTTIHFGEQQHDERSTGRTLANSSKQALTSPPFGSQSFFFEPYQNSSNATRVLRRFYSLPLYSNGCNSTGSM